MCFGILLEEIQTIIYAITQGYLQRKQLNTYLCLSIVVLISQPLMNKDYHRDNKVNESMNMP